MSSDEQKYHGDKILDEMSKSGMFDNEYYLEHNSDVAASKMDALDHYLKHGWRERRRPSAAFDPEAYFEANPDLDPTSVNPLLHWIRNGIHEGRFKTVFDQLMYQRHKLEDSELFDRDYYLAADPNLAIALGDLNVVEHYIKHGWRERRRPSAAFDPEAYFEANPDLDPTSVNPLLHWVLNGARERRLMKPLGHGFTNLFVRTVLTESKLFDANYYLTAYPDVVISGLDPIEHYIDVGWRQNRRPSLEFDNERYAARYPSFRTLGLEPATYYFIIGFREQQELPHCYIQREEFVKARDRLLSSSLFDESYYLRRCPAVRRAGIDPASHYLVIGYKHFFEPAEKSFVKNYIAKFPDVRNLDYNHLLHFVDWGRAAGRTVDIDRIRTNWVKEDNSKPLPDDLIAYELIAGIEFFSRFGFQFSGNIINDYIPEAVDELVTIQTKFVVDEISPDVSIVIPVYGQIHFVLGCLESLSRHESKFSVEIIVIDDASPAYSETDRLASIPWIRYIRCEENEGFLTTCNKGVSMSRGKFAVLLNSDTRVVDGWLDELLTTFDTFPNAGLVGSKLYNEDGTLQEAGGIYWRDGSAWNYGRGDDPNRPKYCFARRVDYVSGASIAVRRSIWDSLSGFDESYRPAYAEDADLAFRIRAAGYEVWMQPLSRIIHYEGKTHGRDETSGIKAYQARNMLRLKERFQNQFSTFRPAGEHPSNEANRFALKKLLVVDAVLPMPDRDSGSFITFKMVKAFRELGYEITFVAQHSYNWMEVYAASLQRIGVEYIYNPYFHKIEDVLKERNDFDYVLAFRHTVLSQIIDQIREKIPKARIIFHNVDLHYLREQREAELRGDRTARVMAAMTQMAEMSLIARADCNIVHTPVEKTIIEGQAPIKNLIVFPYIADVVRSAVPRDQRRNIMFLGGFAHVPNRDAADFLVNEIWPLLESVLPKDCCLNIVGADPTPEVQSLADERVVVTGHVPELLPWFETARVFVAPLRYGAGIKGKLIQSLSHGVPSVATPIASEGVGLLDGIHVLSGQSPQNLADAIIRLYFEEDLWQSMQIKGYEFVDENYSWARCLELCSLSLDVADATWLHRHARKRERLVEEIMKIQGDPS